MTYLSLSAYPPDVFSIRCTHLLWPCGVLVLLSINHPPWLSQPSKGSEKLHLKHVISGLGGCSLDLQTEWGSHKAQSWFQFGT